MSQRWVHTFTEHRGVAGRQASSLWVTQRLAASTRRVKPRSRPWVKHCSKSVCWIVWKMLHSCISTSHNYVCKLAVQLASMFFHTLLPSLRQCLRVSWGVWLSKRDVSNLNANMSIARFRLYTKTCLRAVSPCPLPRTRAKPRAGCSNGFISLSSSDFKTSKTSDLVSNLLLGSGL